MGLLVASALNGDCIRIGRFFSASEIIQINALQVIDATRPNAGKFVPPDS
ncbi:MAG: hypothetical protein JW795_11145 [Chitinivibrionales bacterium]|nr:hypothetical protein [Chitinivibrionales bacterium]